MAIAMGIITSERFERNRRSERQRWLSRNEHRIEHPRHACDSHRDIKRRPLSNVPRGKSTVGLTLVGIVRIFVLRGIPLSATLALIWRWNDRTVTAIATA